MGLITDKDIAKFQKLCEERFGVRLSKQEAQEQSIKLLTLMQLSYKAMTHEDLAQMQKRQKFLQGYSKSPQDDLNPVGS